MSANETNPYAPPKREQEIPPREPRGEAGVITATIMFELDDMMSGFTLTGGKIRWVLPVLFAGMGLISGASMGTIAQIVYSMGFGLLGFALWPLVFRAGARRWLANKSDVERTITLTFSPASVEVTTATTYLRFEWPAVHRFLENRKTFLLYLGESMFQVVPKRAFRTDEVDALRAMLTTRVTPRKRAPTVARVLALWFLLVVLFLVVSQFLLSAR